MKFLRIDSDNPQPDLISEAANEIRKGKVVVYPTDTVYGLGCSISSRDAVKRIYAIKGRRFDKPLSVAFASLEEAKKHVLLSPDEENYILERLGEPMTYIVTKKPGMIPDLVTANKETVGIRIIQEPVFRGISLSAQTPLITTSANPSGGAAPASVRDIDQNLLDAVDLVIDAGFCRHKKPSTVVEPSTGRIIR